MKTYIAYKKNEKTKNPIERDPWRQDHLDIVALYAGRVTGLDIPNKDGDTPLHYAAFHNRPRAAELLLKAGANFEVSNDKGERPIDDAKSRGNEEMIKVLKHYQARSQEL